MTVEEEGVLVLQALAWVAGGFGVERMKMAHPERFSESYAREGAKPGDTVQAIMDSKAPKESE